MKAIALIPARCGSKSIPLKNIKQFNGKPLLYWSLEALQHADHVEKVYVATDCLDIREVALSFGFSKVEVYDRLPENAQDASSTEDLMLEFIEAVSIADEQHLLLVQVTTPFTTADDIDRAVEQYFKEKADSLLTCALTKKFIWDKSGNPLNYDFRNRPRRQDFEGTLIENGAFYLSQVAAIKKSGNRLNGRIAVYQMPEYTLTELDEPEDWLIAEDLMRLYSTRARTTVAGVKLFLSDIDGVMTDAGMYYSEHGDELKKFSTYDGKAFELLRNAGILTGLITTENTLLNERRAQKIKADFVYQGVHDKLGVALEICAKHNIGLKEVAYIGDDVGDVALLERVGFAACPLNAKKQVKAIAGILQLQQRGGEGAVREFAEHVLNL